MDATKDCVLVSIKYKCMGIKWNKPHESFYGWCKESVVLFRVCQLFRVFIWKYIAAYIKFFKNARFLTLYKVFNFSWLETVINFSMPP